MESRSGLVVVTEVSRAVGRAERGAAIRMGCSFKGACQKALGADKGCDAREFVTDLCISGITPRVAQIITRCGRSSIGGRTVHHQGYAQSINSASISTSVSIALLEKLIISWLDSGRPHSWGKNIR
jgi:hypothetical protein